MGNKCLVNQLSKIRIRLKVPFLFIVKGKKSLILLLTFQTRGKHVFIIKLFVSNSYFYLLVNISIPLSYSLSHTHTHTHTHTQSDTAREFPHSVDVMSSQVTNFSRFGNKNVFVRFVFNFEKTVLSVKSVEVVAENDISNSVHS